MKNAHWDTLPRKIRDAVRDLATTLHDGARGDLAAVVVYGSAVRGDWVENQSDVDLLVVLEEGKRATLERMAAPLAKARAEHRIEVMLLVEREIPRAADVFPLFYEDVCGDRAVVLGRDCFAALVVAPEHRRLRIEQELREMRIRLRRGVTDARGDKRALGAAVDRKVKQLRAPLRSLLGLLGTESGPKLDVVLAKACKRFRVDPSDLSRAKDEPLRAHDALAALLDSAIETADTLSLPGAS